MDQFKDKDNNAELEALRQEYRALRQRTREARKNYPPLKELQDALEKAREETERLEDLIEALYPEAVDSCGYCSAPWLRGTRCGDCGGN